MYVLLLIFLCDLICNCQNLIMNACDICELGHIVGGWQVGAAQGCLHRGGAGQSSKEGCFPPAVEGQRLLFWHHNPVGQACRLPRQRQDAETEADLGPCMLAEAEGKPKVDESILTSTAS